MLRGPVHLPRRRDLDLFRIMASDWGNDQSSFASAFLAFWGCWRLGLGFAATELGFGHDTRLFTLLWLLSRASDQGARFEYFAYLLYYCCM